LPLRPELESVPAVELRPPPRVVTEPFPQRMGGTELLRPLIDRGPPPRQASRPQPINKDTFAIPAGGGFVRSLDLDHVLTFPLFGATSRLNLDDWGELNVRVGFAIASGVAGIPDRRPPHIEVLVRWRPILVFGRRVQEPEQRLEGDPVERCVFLESQLVVPIPPREPVIAIDLGCDFSSRRENSERRRGDRCQGSRAGRDSVRRSWREPTASRGEISRSPRPIALPKGHPAA